MSEQRLHILVCDDDFEIVQAIQIYLERAGYTVPVSYTHLTLPTNSRV